MNRLVLKDGGAVESGDKEFCQSLQRTLADEKGSGSVVVPKEWFPNWGNRRIGKLKVFDYFRQNYCVQCFAGFLNFEGRQVLIHSRFDETGALFRYMMTRLSLMPRMLWNHTPEAEAGNFQIPLVYTFLRQVKEAYSIGVYRQYRTFSYNDSHPKGFINIPLHIRKNPLENGRIAYTTREYTADNPINRLILAAWQYIQRDETLGSTARKITQNHPELLTPIKELNYQLNSPHVDRNQLTNLMREAERPITHHMHARYESVRKTSLMILKGLGFEQVAARGRGRVSGMLFPMDIMWEFFLEDAVLKGTSLSTQESIDILIPEGGAALRKIKPDFLLYHDAQKNVLAVLDAKYKEIWGKAYSALSSFEADPPNSGEDSEDDVDSDNDNRVYNTAKPWRDSRIREDSFQVMSYMHVTHAKTGGILFPMVTEEETLPIKKIHLYEGTDEVILLIPVCLPKDDGNFDRYCEEMDTRCALLRTQLLQELADQKDS